MERRKNILSLPALDGDTDNPSVILYKNKVYVDSTGAGYKEVDNGRIAIKRLTPPRATTALSVSELAFDGGKPDIIRPARAAPSSPSELSARLEYGNDG